MSGQERTRLMAAISMLPELQANLITLYYLQNQSSEVICVTLGISSQTFEQVHHAALSQLQKWEG